MKKAKKQVNKKSPIDYNKTFKSNGVTFRYRANTNSLRSARRIAEFFRNGNREMARVKQETNGSFTVYIGDKKRTSKK